VAGGKVGSNAFGDDFLANFDIREDAPGFGWAGYKQRQYRNGHNPHGRSVH
jgi:hypothetical protein